MQAWSSGPLNRHRVGQRGSSLELTSRHLPLEGTASWRGGPPACHHTLLPHRGHTPCLLPPSWGRCCPFLHSREGVHRSPARCPVPRVPEQGISLPAEVTIANICLAFHAFHLTKSSQHTQQGASVIPTGRMVSDLPMSTQVRGEAGPSGAPHPLGPAHAWASLLCHLSAFLLTNPGLVRERCAGLGPAPCRSSLGCARGKIWRTPTNTSGWQPPLQFQSSRGGRETSQLPGEGRPACFRCTPSQVHPLSGAPLSGAPSRFSGERGACFPLEQSLSVVTASCSV